MFVHSESVHYASRKMAHGGGIQPGKTRPWFTSADAGVMGKAEGPEIRCSYQCLDPLVLIFIEATCNHDVFSSFQPFDRQQ